MLKFELMGGQLHVYKRPKSRFWQCYTYLAGRPWRETTKQESAVLAKESAQDWFLNLKGKDRAGELKGGKAFAFAAKQFLAEYKATSVGISARLTLLLTKPTS